jgi:hypothetical protein
MHGFENEGARLELALSLARMTGSEHHFIRLLRQARDDVGTAIAQEMMHLRGQKPLSMADRSLLRDCIDAFAHEDDRAGVAQLVALLRSLPQSNSVESRLLRGCAEGLEQHGYVEYVILALHVLHAG